MTSASDAQYSPRAVVAKMLAKKERKIPGSVFKPHCEDIVLLQSVALGQPQPSARVFFPYPAYCMSGDNDGADAADVTTGDTSTALKVGGAGFLKTNNWA